MDSSSPSSHNWLAFSLSNHPHLHLSLFEAFSSPDPASSVVDSSTTTVTPEDHHHHHHVSADPTDLAIFTGAAGGPKLENFLGGGGGGGEPPMAQFPAETMTVAMSSNNNNNTAEIYESELKTIAASFLRGYNNNTNNININSNNNNEQIEAQHRPAMAVAVAAPAEPAAKKAVDTFGQRTSIYRGVTRHRWTGRYEAHLWDNSCRREGQSRKGRQVYLGGYDKEEKAARAYDLAALKYWGPTTTTNFPVANYEKELEEMKNMTRQEFVASLRRKSSGFSRGASIYRGVTRHHQHGRWQARIGRVAGNKDLYLGTFSTQEEAAEAYDIAAIKFRGLNAVTNFDMSRYDVKSIANSNLPIGGMSNTNRPKNSSDSADSKSVGGGGDDRDGGLSSASSSTLSFALPASIKQDPSDNYWSNIFAFPNPSPGGTTNKNPSALFHSNPNTSVAPFNMDFSATSTTSTTSNGRFLAYSHYQELLQQQQQSGTGAMTATTMFAMPVNVNSYVTTSPPVGYNVNNSSNNNDMNNIGWNEIGASHLQTFHHHHQPHGKPGTLFQTPIFGME